MLRFGRPFSHQEHNKTCRHEGHGDDDENSDDQICSLSSDPHTQKNTHNTVLLLHEGFCRTVKKRRIVLSGLKTCFRPDKKQFTSLLNYFKNSWIIYKPLVELERPYTSRTWTFIHRYKFVPNFHAQSRFIRHCHVQSAAKRLPHFEDGMPISTLDCLVELRSRGSSLIVCETDLDEALSLHLKLGSTFISDNVILISFLYIKNTNKDENFI